MVTLRSHMSKFIDGRAIACPTLGVMDYFIENALKFYGCDWAAMVFTFASLYLLGNKVRTGFLLGVLANFFWFSYGFMTDSIANMACSTIIVVLQVRGWRNWGRDTEPEPEGT